MINGVEPSYNGVTTDVKATDVITAFSRFLEIHVITDGNDTVSFRHTKMQDTSGELYRVVGCVG